jgi:hypothetical protein
MPVVKIPFVQQIMMLQKNLNVLIYDDDDDDDDDDDRYLRFN